MSIDKQTIIKLLIHVLGPLIIGVLVYHFFTDRDILITRVMADIFGNDGDLGVDAPQWVTNHLQDGLWPYSFASAILIIHECSLDRRSIPWIMLAVCIPLALEVGQKFGIFKGTFDPIDIIWSLCGSIASILILTYKRPLL